MSFARNILRRRFFSSGGGGGGSISQRHEHQHHEFLSPNSYVNSWKPPRDPKEAYARLAKLRRDYEQSVKEVRKRFIAEVEAQRLEKLRKDDARKEALKLANEQRQAAKAQKKKAEAIERHAAEQQFREMLMKERAEKLEYWRKREIKVTEKKKEKNDLVRRQSSLWIAESDIEKKAVEAITDSVKL